MFVNERSESDMPMDSQPQSRRRGAAKAMLSQERIVSTTIDIMRRDGLKKATMRRVATELETGPASLYVYIRNTAELHAMVVDTLLGTIDVPTTGTWTARIEQTVTAYRDVLAGGHGLARSALAVRPSGPNVMRLYDRIMSLLMDGGASPVNAAWGADMLLLHATATAAEHAAPEDGDVDAGTDSDDAHTALSLAVRTADTHALPTLARHADAVMSGTPEQRWKWALRAQIAGIASAPE
jgi:AcrR family transcriptional regulator